MITRRFKTANMRSRNLNRPRVQHPPVSELDNRRDKILKIATDHFACHGYHETDVQFIADEASLGKGTIYRWFGSKEGLFLAAGDRVMRLLHAEVEAVRKRGTPPKEVDPLDQISLAVVAYLAFFDANPAFVELLIQERAVFRDRKKPTYFEHRERNIGPWQELYRRMIAAGRVRKMPVDVITDVLSSALYGTMFTNYFAGRKKPLERQAEQILEVVFLGILSEPERSSRSKDRVYASRSKR
jgi:AcrR family transcriptional regulator